MATARAKTDAEQAKADGIGETDDQSNPGQVEMQKTVDTAEERGFYGVEVDQTPNHHYTVDGVTSGKATPETTKGQA